MSNELVSIIIPVYNTEAYLNRCLSSIVCQEYSNIQIICVNDGSSDKSIEILNSEAEKDERVEVIHLDRSVGAGEARNIGMREAKGEYLMFLDSDDYFDPTMVDCLYRDISENKADICICGFVQFDNSTGKIVYNYYPKGVDGITDNCFRLSQLGENALTLSNSGPCNKIYRRDFLFSNNITFQSLSSSNDVSFSYLCYLKADRIVYSKCKTPLLNYRVNTDTQISHNRNSLNHYYAVNNVIETMGKDITNKEFTQIVFAFVSLSVYELQNCKEESLNREFYKMVREFLDCKKDNYSITDYEINSRINSFMTLDYDSYWFDLKKEFYKQISSNFMALSRRVRPNEKIVVWGNGTRSMALQLVFVDRGYGDVFITDIKDDKVGEKTQCGYKIIGTEEARVCGRKIIASNSGIYEQLRTEGIDSINLEEYCG